MHASLCVDFAVIQSQCCELSIPIPRKLVPVQASLHGLYCRATGGGRDYGAACSIKQDVYGVVGKSLYSGGSWEGLTDDNCLLGHKLVILKVDKERCKARESVDKRYVTDRWLELAYVEEALRSLEKRSSADRLLMFRVFGDQYCAQKQLAATLGNF